MASVNDTANFVPLSSLTTNITDENIQDKINLSSSGTKESINSLSIKPFVSNFTNNISSISSFDNLDKL
ncbi:TPA: hypothetical protein DEG21_01350 [Patescibacteria group bacterium]|nr:hypothetical protein [Candidatus Gracilibacteria bacterium]HBY74542.1 hypothetical protein [Candidatus Gracilibacteria bacterium]